MTIRCLSVLVALLGIARYICAQTPIAPLQNRGIERASTVLPEYVARPQNGQATQPLEGSDFELKGPDATPATKDVAFKFNLNGLPPGACVTKWTLRLYVSSPGGSDQDIGARLIQFDGTNIKKQGANKLATSTVASEDPIVDFNYQIAETLKGNEKGNEQCGWLKSSNYELGIRLTPETLSTVYKYYGQSASCESRGEGCNTQPRLILRYYRNPVSTDANWLQSKFDAQHSGQTVWKTNAIKQINQPEAKGFGYIKQPPLIYKGQLIFHTQKAQASGSAQYFITAANAALQELWDPVDVKETVSFPLTIDEQGRIYVFTPHYLWILNAEEAGKVLNSYKADSPGESTCSGPSFLCAEVKDAPTLGVSPIMYLPTEKGLFALKFYPKLTTLWMFGGEILGQAVLNRDESTAYVVDGKKKSLVAIDTSDGKELWRSMKLELTTTPPSIAIASPGAGQSETELIYVSTDTGLLVFKGCKRSSDEKNNNKCAELGKKEQGPIKEFKGSVSAPVIASQEAYFIKKSASGKGEVCRYVWPSLEAECAKPTVDALNIHTTSQLAADGAGNVYIVDPVSSPEQVLEVKHPPAAGDKLSIIQLLPEGIKSPDLNLGPNNLLMGDDGTLYNASESRLYAMRPKAPETDINLDSDKIEASDTTAWLAQHQIVVKGGVTIKSTQSLVLESGGSIVFGSEVKVEKGAQLSCRIQPTLK